MVDLINKYRPDYLEGVIGQDLVINSLRGLINDEKLPHAILLSGPSGVGKTTIARALSNQLECGDRNIIEVDAATYSGIDNVKELTKGLQFNGFGENPTKFYIIDECHSLSKQAWQALLKSIEEPPDHIYFVFCTTDYEKVPDTIRTRCHCYTLLEVNEEKIVELLRWIAQDEELDIEDSYLDLIAESSGGSPREALSKLSMCRNIESVEELRSILKSPQGSKEVIDLCRYIFTNKGDFGKAVSILKTIDPSVESESIRLIIINYYAKVILGKGKNGDLNWHLKILSVFSGIYNRTEKMAPVLLSLWDLYEN